MIKTIDKFDHTKFFKCIKIHKQNKKHLINLENIFSRHITYKGLTSLIHNKLLKLEWGKKLIEIRKMI